MKKLTFLVVFSTSFLAATSQESSALVEMVSAEKAFAAEALSGGVAQAFMKYLDDSAIVFEQGKIMNGKDVWRNRKPGEASLIWYPEFAEVSAAGDMGYTTGPAQFRAVAKNEKPDYTGYFNSVWKKNRNGEWKVLLDMGTPSEDADYDDKKTEYASDRRTTTATKKTADDDVKMLEEKFIAEYAGGKGYSTYASPTARYYRPHAKVSKGTQLTADAAKLQFRNAGSGLSSSGDLGYAYGYVTASGAEGNYLRVWKKEQGKWKIVLDAASY